MYDVLQLCIAEERDGKTWYMADPSVVVPATVARIQEVLASKWQVHLPDELVNMDDEDPSIATKAMVQEAALLPDFSWDIDLPILPEEPNEETEPGEHSQWLVLRSVRRQVLSQAWAWFKRALSLKVGKTVLLHITRDENYKE